MESLSGGIKSARFAFFVEGGLGLHRGSKQRVSRSIFPLL